MLSKREIEEFIGRKLTDEEWKKLCDQFSEIQEKMWEEDHPLDL